MQTLQDLQVCSICARMRVQEKKNAQTKCTKTQTNANFANFAQTFANFRKLLRKKFAFWFPPIVTVRIWCVLIANFGLDLAAEKEFGRFSELKSAEIILIYRERASSRERVP